MMSERNSPSRTDPRADDVEEATSCGEVLVLLRAELAARLTAQADSSVVTELRRAVAILIAAEGVRTATATLAIECEKPHVEGDVDCETP